MGTFHGLEIKAMKISSAYSSLYSQLRGNRFTSNLEDYIDRTRHGLDKGSSNVPEELGVKSSLSNSYLASTNPGLLQKYSGYVTAFSYDKRGRFVSNLDDSFSQIEKISKRR